METDEIVVENPIAEPAETDQVVETTLNTIGEGNGSNILLCGFEKSSMVIIAFSEEFLNTTDEPLIQYPDRLVVFCFCFCVFISMCFIQMWKRDGLGTWSIETIQFLIILII